MTRIFSGGVLLLLLALLMPTGGCVLFIEGKLDRTVWRATKLRSLDNSIVKQRNVVRVSRELETHNCLS